MARRATQRNMVLWIKFAVNEGVVRSPSKKSTKGMEPPIIPIVMRLAHFLGVFLVRVWGRLVKSSSVSTMPTPPFLMMLKMRGSIPDTTINLLYVIDTADMRAVIRAKSIAVFLFFIV